LPLRELMSRLSNQVLFACKRARYAFVGKDLIGLSLGMDLCLEVASIHIPLQLQSGRQIQVAGNKWRNGTPGCEVS
jgi:hypothetical protein